MSKFVLRIIVFFICIANSFSGFGQLTPSGISYQGVLRGSDGLELISESVTVEFAVRQGAPDGIIVYEENHPLITTNQFGLFQAIIGAGVYTGVGAYPSLSAIPWEMGPYFMEVRATIPGQGNPQLIGVSQLLSVPYSMFADQASTVLNETDGDPFNEVITGVTMNANQLIIEEGDSSFGIDLSILQGSLDSDATNELITSVVATSPTQIQIAEGSNLTNGDLSAIAYNTWSRTDNAIHNDVNRIGIGTSQPSSSLDINGSVSVSLRVITSLSTPTSDTLKVSDHALLCNVTQGDLTLKLPDAELCEGRLYKIRKLFSGVSTEYVITLVPLLPTQTIDLNNTFILGHDAAEYVTLISDGNNWFLLDHSKE